MSITGNLRTLEISELLQWLAHGRKTGALMIERDGSQVQIWFDEGRIIGSCTSNPDEHLSRMLIERGLVDQATMARALKLQEATQILLGRVLVTLGSLSESDLRRILQSKTEETAYGVFSWPEGDFKFVGEGVPEQPMIPISLDVTNLVLEGMHRIDELRRKEAQSADAGAALPPEVLETQIIEPILNVPMADTEQDSESDSASQPDSETEVEPAEPVLPAAAPDDETAPTVIAAAADGETSLDVEDPDSPEVRGYYQTIPAKKMNRKSLFGILAAAAVVVLAVGGWLYFSSRGTSEVDQPPVMTATLETADPVPVSATEPATSEPLDPTEIPLESGVLTGETEAATAAETGRDPRAVAAPDTPPVADEDGDSVAVMEARVQQIATAQTAVREDELRQEYESELETLRAQLEEANKQAEERAAEQARRTEAELSQGGQVATGAQTPNGVDTAREPGPTTARAEVPATQTPPTTAPPTAVPPPPAEPEEPEVKRGDLLGVESGAAPPAMLDPPKPRYPPAARRLRREAVIDLRVLVDENGKVVEVERRGKKAGMGFDEAAIDAARKTTWQPASKNGVAVKMWVDLKIQFRP